MDRSAWYKKQPGPRPKPTYSPQLAIILTNTATKAIHQCILLRQKTSQEKRLRQKNIELAVFQPQLLTLITLSALKKLRKRRKKTNTIETGIGTNKNTKKTPLSLPESMRPSLVSRKRRTIIRIKIADTKHVSLARASVLIVKKWATMPSTARKLQKIGFGLSNLRVGNWN